MFNEAIDPAKIPRAAFARAVVAGRPGGGAARLPVRQHRRGVHAEPAADAGRELSRAVAGGGGSVRERAKPRGSTTRSRTTDGTPPSIVQLVVAGNGTVIENTATSVTATVGAFDVAFVDFFLNDVFSATVPAPFVFSFQAGADARQARAIRSRSRRSRPTRRAAAARLSAALVPITLDRAADRARSRCRRRASTPATASRSTSTVVRDRRRRRGAGQLQGANRQAAGRRDAHGRAAGRRTLRSVRVHRAGATRFRDRRSRFRHRSSTPRARSSTRRRSTSSCATRCRRPSRSPARRPARRSDPDSRRPSSSSVQDVGGIRSDHVQGDRRRGADADRASSIRRRRRS